MRVFRLYQFSDGLTNVITRGLTVEQAMSYAVKSPAFKRGSTIFPINFCPINAKALYSANHSDGWLYRAPVWLRKQEHKQASEMGFKKVMENLFCITEPEVLLFEGSR